MNIVKQATWTTNITISNNTNIRGTLIRFHQVRVINSDRGAQALGPFVLQIYNRNPNKPNKPKKYCYEGESTHSTG